MLEPKVFTVAQINRYIKNMMENDFILNSLWVKGEISNFKAHSSGHLYFTLKDSSSSISCVMFQGAARLLPYLPENGMSVVICGYISLYEKTGHYQIYAELMEPVGMGALNMAYEQLKARLEQEGLFDKDYKREITKYPHCVAVITSPTGAAVRDIIRIIKRRNKQVKVVVVPALVQGDMAADSIVSGLKLVNEWGRADTIIVGRGGGSIEDLWAFNEEKVARAIFASEIPVIAAIGHETDFTIADFTADMRASTPSAAAELAVSSLEEVKEHFADMVCRMKNAAVHIISYKKEQLAVIQNRPVLKRPLDTIHNYQIFVEDKKRQLDKEINRIQKRNQLKQQEVLKRLEAVSPFSVLKRGYGLVYTKENKIVTNSRQVLEGEEIQIKFYDSSITVVVKENREEYNGEKKGKL